MILILLFSINVNANWVKESDQKYPVTVWAHKSQCESFSSEKCVDITGKDMRRWKIGTNGLEPDPAGIIAADAEDAQKASDLLTRNNAKTTRKTNLQQCVQDSKNPTLSPSEVKSCLRAIVRELLGSKVGVEDL